MIMPREGTLVRSLLLAVYRMRAGSLDEVCHAMSPKMPRERALSVLNNAKHRGYVTFADGVYSAASELHAGLADICERQPAPGAPTPPRTLPVFRPLSKQYIASAEPRRPPIEVPTWN